MNDLEHFGRIAHILTRPKRAVLSVLDQCGPSDQERIVDCWRSIEPTMRPLVSESLPQMISPTIWKLDNLELVTRDERGLWSITSAGREALAA